MSSTKPTKREILVQIATDWLNGKLSDSEAKRQAIAHAGYREEIALRAVEIVAGQLTNPRPRIYTYR